MRQFQTLVHAAVVMISLTTKQARAQPPRPLRNVHNVCVQRREIRSARKHIAELSEEVQSTKKAKTKLMQDLDEALQEIRQLKGPAV